MRNAGAHSNGLRWGVKFMTGGSGQSGLETRFLEETGFL